MERITYRKTLDVHKNGIQFMLQGFETADKLSRVIEISLMGSGDAIDFPLERMVAMMYVTTPSAKEPSINSCTIKDNKVVYEVLPIVEEGITNMQLKLMEISPEGATSVLASPKFVVEVTKSNVDDEGAEQTPTFTALEDAVARAKAVYDARFLRMELTNDCIFKVYYAGENEEHGAIYETDILKKLFHTGNAILSESFAHGGTGTRIDEDTDNSMYYSNVSKSEALNAKAIMEDSKGILEEVKLHGMYTAFSVDFESGHVEYVSPSFRFKINKETGELEAEGQTYTFDDEVGRVVTEWLATNGVNMEELQAISTRHTEEISSLKDRATNHTKDINELAKRVTPVSLGGTGATTKEEALENLGVTDYQKPWNVDANLGAISAGGVISARCNPGSVVKDKYYESESEKIYMKNSGKIYAHVTVECAKVMSELQFLEASIRINGLTVFSFAEFVDENPLNDKRDFTRDILLNVNKGDVLSVDVKGIGIGNTTSSGSLANYIGCYINQLYANVETPYTYLNLEEGNTEINSVENLSMFSL